jgi:hypothetical protein
MQFPALPVLWPAGRVAEASEATLHQYRAQSPGEMARRVNKHDF